MARVSAGQMIYIATSEVLDDGQIIDLHQMDGAARSAWKLARRRRRRLDMPNDRLQPPWPHASKTLTAV